MPDDAGLDDDHHEIEILFPKLGDQLFVTEQNSHLNAQINYVHSWDTSYRYVLGYKLAADRLVQSLIENRYMIDLVIFPTVFLYRHYLELRLKQLLIEGNYLFDKQISFPKHHRIDVLWNDCKSLLKKIIPQMTDQNVYVMALEACIIEFSKIDPLSMAFRYHVDTNNSPSLPPDLKYINVRNLADIMTKIHSLLETWYDRIVEFQEYERIDKLTREADRELELLKAELDEEFRSFTDEDWRNYFDMFNR